MEEDNSCPCFKRVTDWPPLSHSSVCLTVGTPSSYLLEFSPQTNKKKCGGTENMCMFMYGEEKNPFQTLCLAASGLEGRWWPFVRTIFRSPPCHPTLCLSPHKHPGTSKHTKAQGKKTRKKRVVLCFQQPPPPFHRVQWKNWKSGESLTN